MSGDYEPATAREDTSLMPDFLGLSAVWTLFYVLLCVIGLGATAITTLLLDLSAVAIVGVVGGVLMAEILVGLVLWSMAVVSPSYLSTWEFAATRLRARYGQQRVRHDDVARRTFPDFEQFDETTNESDTDE